MAASRSPLPGRKYSFKNLQVIVVFCFLFLEETEEATLLLLFSESRERNENGDVLVEQVRLKRQCSGSCIV